MYSRYPVNRGEKGEKGKRKAKIKGRSLIHHAIFANLFLSL